MIQRMSDEEVISLTMRVAQKRGIYEYNVARAVEDLYIPQLEKMQEDLAQLTAKHERLVKGLKELKRFGISEGEFGQFSWTAVDADDMSLLLKESEGE